MRIFKVLVIIVLFVSCKRDEKSYINLKVNLKGEIGYKFEWKDIYIPIDSKTYTDYAIFTSFSLGNCDYISGYNKKYHSIDIFDITNVSFLKHIYLDSEGPNGLNQISGLFFHNWDSIFIYSSSELSIIDSAGRINFKKNLIDFSLVEKEKKGTISSPLGFNICYSKERNSVFLQYTPRNVTFGSNEFYKVPFVAEYSLMNSTLELIPIYYSDFFSENNNVGYLFMPFVSLFENFICYNFSGESNIYLYNLQTKENFAFGGRSSFTKNMTFSIPPNADITKVQQHNIESVAFLYTYYDKYRNLYYRLHYGDQEYQISNNQFNTYNDKDLYLMVFTENFELIKEIKLDKNTYYPDFFGVTKPGLLLNANHESNKEFSEDVAHFRLLNITSPHEN